MKIKHKLIATLVGATVVSITAVSLVIGVMSINKGKTALEHQEQNQLVSIRDIKKSQIEDYFATINNQIKTFSNNRMIIDAMAEFKPAFNNITSEIQDVDSFRSSVASYYSNKFGPKYQEMNAGRSADTSGLLSRLDQQSIALQYLYISNNPNPLGSKDGLSQANDGSAYSRLHKKYHPHIRDYLNKFGFYDIFLVDPDSGDIVYSVYKELDYSTSLKNGPYANTGIGKAFSAANNAGEGEFVTLTDFDSYLPSYEAPASFTASPIFDGNKKIGVLIFQMPIDKINSIMTYEKQWKSVGLGESGETYLVGSDYTARSMSRFLIEDKKGYLSLLANLNISGEIIDGIRDKDTNIGIQKIKTAGTKAALRGETGFSIFPDYRGVPVLSAYAPLNIPGVNWAIMSELDEAEAFAAVDDLKASIFGSAATIYIIMIGLAVFFALWFSAMFTKPISLAAEGLKRIAKGDLTQSWKVKSKDELGEMLGHLNEMSASLSSIVGNVVDSSNHIASGSQQIAAGNINLSQRTEEQASSLEETASSMEEMTSVVKQNSGNADEARAVAEDNTHKAQKGSEVVTKTVAAMAEINAASARIADIITTIDGIAFQTNLLALNAAVEAARAGEQGRGFAVVAAEVRTLAQRSASAAKEIKDLIEDTVDKVKTGTELVDESGSTLKELIEGIQHVSTIVTEIAASSREQASGIEQVNSAVTQMDDMTQQNAALVEEAAAASRSMQNQASGLIDLVRFFKLDKQDTVIESFIGKTDTENKDATIYPADKAIFQQKTGTSDSNWENF